MKASKFLKLKARLNQASNVVVEATKEVVTVVEEAVKEVVSIVDPVEEEVKPTPKKKVVKNVE